MDREPILRRIAEETVGDKARYVWKRMDIIGDIALIKKELKNILKIEDYKKIANKLLEELPYIKSVWLVAGPVEGRYKTRTKLIHLAGEKRTTTIYKEHGCRFKIDISKVFITPRLNYEHKRIAEQVAPGETIINMFSGAGLFSIIIACRARPRRVYSIDINEYAVKLIEENARLNKVDDIVVPLLGDAKEVVESRLVGVADRVLMPLPDLSLAYLPQAILALRGRGIIHVYLHVASPKGVNPLEESARLVSQRLREIGISSFTIRGVRRVRPVGPRMVQTVVDVEVERVE